MTTSHALDIVSVDSPAPRREWDDLLAADPDALMEQGPAWIDAMSKAAGWRDCSRFYRLNDGRAFVLPLVRKQAQDLAPQSGFAPSWGIGGLVGPRLDSAVTGLIQRDLAALSAVSIHVRPNPTQGDHWSAEPSSRCTAIPRSAHVISLADKSDETFARFSSTGRRKVRRAERMGVAVTTYVGGDGLDGYYRDLYLPSVLRWAEGQNEPAALALWRGKRRDPLDKLEKLGDALGESFRLTIASVEGKAAAGNLVLFGPNAHYTRGAMNQVGEKNGAAYLAMWHAIQHANDNGSRWFHMGETGSSQSLRQYKERFGAVAFDYNEYRFERLPFLKVDQLARSTVKRVLNFRD